MALYGRIDYWNGRYQDTSAQSYDWYQSYESLRHLLEARALMAATKQDDGAFPSMDECRVLILGCGNSTFCDDMHRDGWKGKIVNVDYSSVVVDQMQRKYPHAEFICADVTKGLPFEEKSFDLIICKATLDAILCGPGSVADAKTMVAECSRLLQNDHGVLFIVSHGNPDNRVEYLEHENDISFYWKEVSIHKVDRANSDKEPSFRSQKKSSKHDYVYICRKRLEDVVRPGRPLPRFMSNNENLTPHLTSTKAATKQPIVA